MSIRSAAPGVVFSFRAAACALLSAAVLVAVAAPAAAADPTPSRLGYSTPLVAFASPHTPLLRVVDGSDVAALATGAPVARPLVEQLQLLFDGFFSTAGQGSVQAVQLQVGYASLIASGLGPQVQVPIALVRSPSFAVPGDWSPGTACLSTAPEDPAFVCRVAQLIRLWVDQQQPTASAQLTFDLAARPSGSTLPLVRVTGLTLRRADITDL